MPRKRLLPLFVCLAAIAAAAAVAAVAAAQRPETFEDKLFVREVELVFEAPEPTLLHPFPPDEDDLVVIEDGRPPGRPGGWSRCSPMSRERRVTL